MDQQPPENPFTWGYRIKELIFVLICTAIAFCTGLVLPLKLSLEWNQPAAGYVCWAGTIVSLLRIALLR